MSFIGAPVASAISTGASTANTKATNETNLQIARETNQANKDLAFSQNLWNLAQWQRENKYNAPSAQAQRLREAGLSSAAAAQAVSNVPAGNLQSADLANQQMGAAMQPVPPEAFSHLANALDFVGFARQIQALRKETADADKSKIEAYNAPKLIFTDLQAKEVANKLAWQDFYYKSQANPVSLRTLKYDLQMKKFQTYGEKLANQTKNITIDLMKQNFSFLEKKNEAELNQMNEELKNTIENRNKTIAEKNKIVAETGVANEQKKLISKESVIKELEAILIKHGNPPSVAHRTAALLSEDKLSLEDYKKDVKNIRRYMLHGHKELGDSELTLPYLENVLDEGQSQENKFGLYQLGTGRSLIGRMFNRGFQ